MRKDSLLRFRSDLEDEARDARPRPMETCREIGGDLLHGLRRMRRRPGITLVAAGTLALGLGAAVTLFSLINGLFLKPLPGVAEQERLVKLLRADPDEVLAGFTSEEIEALREGQDVLTGLAAFRGMLAGVGGVVEAEGGAGGAPEGGEDHGSGADEGRSSPTGGELRVAQEVSAEYFSVLGVQPAHGRFFLPEDTRGTGAPAVVLGHSLWRQRFRGDPDLLGRAVRIRGEPHTVVGVAPAGFGGTFVGFVAELWVPLPEGTNPEGLETVGRLAAGVTRERAAEVFAALGRHVGERLRPGELFGVRVLPETGFDESLQGAVTTFAAILMTIAVLVLGVAGFNVANLLLARSAERQREMAVRAAMGAGRRRLVRQLLTESLLLAGLAGAGSWLLALAGARALASFSPRLGALAIRLDLSPDLRVMAFALLVALLTTVAAALIPALRACHPRRLAALRSGGRGARSSRMVPALVVAQLAVTVLLLAATSLFVRALHQAATRHPGFDSQSVLTLALRTPDGEPVDDATRRLHQRLEQDLATLPSVEAVSRVVGLPLSPGILAGRVTAPVEIDGVPAPPDGTRDETGWRIEYSLAGPGYFQVMGIPMLQGRGFRSTDRMDGPGVAVVNRTFAERFLTEQTGSANRLPSVVGRPLRVRDQPVTVVGVVEDSKVGTVDEAPRPFLYLSVDQHPARTVTFVLRTAGAPEAPIPAVRRALRRRAPEQLVLQLAPMERVIRTTLLPQRMAASVSGVFGLLGLLLAAVGVSGMLAYSVSRRRQEIGVRLALGADRRDVVGLVLGRGLRLAGLGLGLGLLAALTLSPLLSSFLAGLSPADPLAYLAVVGLLGLTTVPALWFPSRRALAVEPRTALEES